MALYQQTRTELLTSLADEFLDLYGVRHRSLIGVDGVEGGLQSAFADDLADTLRQAGRTVFRAHLDDFQRPQTEWDDGPGSWNGRAHASEPSAAAIAAGEPPPEPDADDRAAARRAYERRYDLDLFRRVLVQPFRMPDSTGFVLAAYDAAKQRPVESSWVQTSDDAILIVDGVWMLRPELRDLWQWTVRVNEDAAPGSADELYEHSSRIPQLTLVSIDAHEPGALRRIFHDAC